MEAGVEVDLGAHGRRRRRREVALQLRRIKQFHGTNIYHQIATLRLNIQLQLFRYTVERVVLAVGMSPEETADLLNSDMNAYLVIMGELGPAGQERFHSRWPLFLTAVCEITKELQKVKELLEATDCTVRLLIPSFLTF
jgi:hypothetical protein